MVKLAAGRRSKKRYNLVPRGKALYEDDTRFGTKMLEKMGWSKGKGLGAKEEGSKDFVRLRYKNDAEGLGYEARDDQWTQHEKSFNGLLQSLSENSTNNIDHDAREDADAELRHGGLGFSQSTATNGNIPLKAGISGQSLEERSKQSRARVHYKKFTRGKDLVQYSEKDLANIFGKKELNEVTKTVEKSFTEDTKENEVQEDNFRSSTLFVGDYFKMKMEALKQKQPEKGKKQEEEKGGTKEELKESTENETEKVVSKKKRKKRDTKEEIEEESTGNETEKVVSKKKRKKCDEIEDKSDKTMHESKEMKESNENETEKKVSKKKRKNRDTKEENKKSVEQKSLTESKEETQESTENETEKTVSKKKRKNCDTKGEIEEKSDKTFPEPKQEITASNEIETESSVSKKKRKNRDTKEEIKESVKEKSDKTLPESKEEIKKPNENETEKPVSKEKQKNRDTKEEIKESIEEESVKARHKSKEEIEEESNENETENIDIDKTIEKIQNALKAQKIYEISNFTAEQFRFADFNAFQGANLAQVNGYCMDEDVQLKIIQKSDDEPRILELWSSTIDNISKPNTTNTYKTYQQSVRDARLNKLKIPHFKAHQHRRQNAFNVVTI